MNGSLDQPGMMAAPPGLPVGPSQHEPVGWCVSVSAYRFFIAADQVALVEAGSAVHPVHHLPSWLAGMALAGGRLLGVLDLGRFLGVSRAVSGCLIVPHRRVGEGWGLQVRDAAPVCSAVEECPMGGDSAEALAPSGTLLARPRPDFSPGRVAWMGDQGERTEADRLCLVRLLDHPRLRELQS